MPSLFNIFGYKVYFWTNENGEPIHVHVCKRNPSAKATKIWITQYGGTVVKNYSKIPKKDLVKLEEFIRSNIPSITQAWINIFGSISYYC